MGLNAPITPVAEIKADGKDLTAALANRLMSLMVTDRAGFESDTVEITLADPEPRIAMPRFGVKLEVAIGYQETGTRNLGTFAVDEVELSGPPSQVLIRGKALDTTGAMKESKSRTWVATPEKKVRLREVLDEIARDHGLMPIIDSEYQKTLLTTVVQHNESDTNLLTRLAKCVGAVTKIAAGRLLFAKPNTGKTKSSGKELPTIPLAPHQISTWNLTQAERDAYKSVSARYHNLASGKTEKVSVGEGKPVLAIKEVFSSGDEALKAAQGKLDAITSAGNQLELTMPGDNRILAELPLEISDIRSGVNGRWIVQEVTHTLEPARYSLDVVAVVPGQEKKNSHP